MSWLRLVTFDATGTLLKLRGTVGQQYAAACKKHHVRVDEGKIAEGFKQHWTQMSASHPCFGVPSMSSHLWWSLLVKGTLLSSGCSPQELDPVFDKIFNTLWEDYKTDKLWEVDKDAWPVLDHLTSTGVHVAIVSNFDERLLSVLESVKLKKYFEGPKHELSPLLITTSREAEAEKPDNKIFDYAIKKVQIATKEQFDVTKCLHIGDNRKKDIDGALAHGMKAAFLKRKEKETDSDLFTVPTPSEPYYSISSLAKLLDVVDHVNKTAPR